MGHSTTYRSNALMFSLQCRENIRVSIHLVRLISGCLILLFLPDLAKCNNLKINNLQLVTPDRISLEISWKNSWNLPDTTAPGNHDAVWLFVKWTNAGGPWSHVQIDSDSTKHTSTSMLVLIPSSDGIGIMIRRSAFGSGDILFQPIELALSQSITGTMFELSAYGIEMVYVPEGSFFLGDGQQFHHFREESSGNPFLVSSAGSINGLSVGDSIPIPQMIPDSFPNGYEGFYLMKYEITQDQYCDFLNTLEYDQQAARTAISPSQLVGNWAMTTFGPFRNRIVIRHSGSPPNLPAVFALDRQGNSVFNEPDDGGGRAASYLTWNDVAAYLDWAGLRPMTELEFEKACRGPESPLGGEFAWGTASVVDANTLVMDGTSMESVSEVSTSTAGLASHGYLGPSGPLRSGFGGSDSSSRLQLGAGYYGHAELSGNLWETCVSVNQTGIGFTGESGDGQLSPIGEANQMSWPSAEGAIVRGGAHNSGITGPYRDLAISDRFYADLVPNTRRNTTGGRGAITLNP